MADFIPQGDAEAIAHGKNLQQYMAGNLAALGLTTADVASLTDALDDFESTYNNSVTKKAESEAASEQKNQARKAYETVLRKLNSELHDVADAHRAAMDLTIKDTIRTTVGAPVTHPVGEVETSQRLVHIIHFRDELTPDSKAKPDGAHGAEIWLKIGGTPPVDHKECDFVATDSRTPYNYNFEGADAGKTAYYLLRWINSKGEAGPWSPLVQATITG